MPSKKKLRHVLPTLLITLTGALGWWLSDLLSVINLVTEEKTGPIPLFSMKNMTASFIDDNGKKKYTLMAKIMHRYSGARGTTLKNLHLIQHKPVEPICIQQQIEVPCLRIRNFLKCRAT